MDNIKNYIVSGLTVVLVVLVVVFFQKVPIVNNVVNVPEQQAVVGAVSGNEVQGNYLTVGGVTKGYFSQGFNVTSATVASTTACMFKTGEATSTLQFASGKVSS